MAKINLTGRAKAIFIAAGATVILAAAIAGGHLFRKHRLVELAADARAKKALEVNDKSNVKKIAVHYKNMADLLKSWAQVCGQKKVILDDLMPLVVALSNEAQAAEKAAMEISSPRLRGKCTKSAREVRTTAAGLLEQPKIFDRAGEVNTALGNATEQLQAETS